MSDNTTAISYVNNKGGIKSEICNEIAKELWLWCYCRKLWISAAHIPGKQNIEADRFSRDFNETIEWKLNPDIFNKVTKLLGTPSIDLFASRINYQIKRYVSWKPDPKAIAIDAFSLKWDSEFYYIFPPFSLLGKVAAKIYKDHTKCIVLMPKWTTQHWYPNLMKLAKATFLITPATQNLIQPQNPTLVHPLHKKMHLQAVLIG